ncbi:hypothetical protein DOY81_001279 [Sarcophaga bullata]|nr:hypothetical protein DOY81_001279 [Sarcophaga bullata]
MKYFYNNKQIFTNSIQQAKALKPLNLKLLLNKINSLHRT